MMLRARTSCLGTQMNTRSIAMVLATLSLLSSVLVQGAEPPSLSLVVIGPDFNLSKVKTEDATVVLHDSALHVSTGQKGSWPGITLPAPGKWDLSRFGQVELEVKNTGTRSMSVSCRVDNPGANGTD